jgi:hypothetical protein
MAVIGMQFYIGHTYLSVSEKEYSDLMMPDMTLCPTIGYKYSGLFYTLEELEDKKFTIDDLFETKTVELLRNSSAFTYRASSQILIIVANKKLFY